MAEWNDRDVDTQPTGIQAGDCPGCSKRIVCDASRGEDESTYDNDPRTAIEHLQQCGCAAEVNYEMQCVCGKQYYWFANLFHHVMNEHDNWPALLVGKTLEQM